MNFKLNLSLLMMTTVARSGQAAAAVAGRLERRVRQRFGPGR
jgi:hypothetical protein